MLHRRPSPAKPTSQVVAIRPDVVPLPRRRADGTPLGTLERDVVNAVDGERTVGEIAKLAGLSNGEMGLVIARLAELGVVLLPGPEIPVSLDGLDEVSVDDVDRGWSEPPPDDE